MWARSSSLAAATSSPLTGAARDRERSTTSPWSVMTTTSRREGARSTTSRWRRVRTEVAGYWTRATWRVNWASRRTVRSTTSSMSALSDRKLSTARLSGAVIGLRVARRSTNTR